VPLTRDTVTAASRVMLPAYVVLFAYLGLNYTITGPRLTDSPSLAYADTLAVLPVWGCMFLATSAVMVVAIMQQERLWFRFALWVGIVCMTLWTGVFAVAVLLSNASPGAPAWPAFVAVACFATDRSLLKGEA
jgi:hypothetical protein